MSFFDEKVLWGVEIWRLVAATLLIFGGLTLRRVIVGVFRGALSKTAERTKAEWDDELVEFLPAPLSVMAQVGLWFVAAQVLALPQEPVALETYVLQGLEVAFWVAAIWLAFRLVDVLAASMSRAADRTSSKLDDQLIPLIRRTLKLVIAVTAGVMIVQNLGYSVTSLVASLGVGGLALALAAKDTVANLFGSLVIFTDRPFQIGDWIQFGDVEGTVEEVGFRTTVVRRFDKASVMVPNATFSSEAITNFSRRNVRRIVLNVGVSYATTGAQMQELLRRIRALVTSHPEIDQGFHFVHFVGFGDSSLDVQVYCFTRSAVWTEFLAAQEDLMLQVMGIVEELGLEFAFPSRTVYLRRDDPEPPLGPGVSTGDAGASAS
ncbi:MAG TPA: mechanosensitive ion channel family protein [Polyangiaceae bacterium LLY-WYZ-14_1]|nr:mechanosensitive ion channel family protein [Polyangiaceae bacterium LLY-WYZ-14_1]